MAAIADTVQIGKGATTVSFVARSPHDDAAALAQTAATLFRVSEVQVSG